VLIFEVCAFDASFNKKDNITISKESEKLFNEIISYLTDETEYNNLSNEAKDILFILNDELTFLFTAALLFIKTDVDEISKYIDVKPDLIGYFKEFFFRVDSIRGQIAKIGFFKRLIVAEEQEKQHLGIILKSAHTFGIEYVKWKFGLVELSPESEKIMESTFKDMYFKYMETSFENKMGDILSHIRAGKQLISAAADIQKAYSTGGSTMDDIKSYLVKLQEESGKSSIDIEEIDIDEINNQIEQKEET